MTYAARRLAELCAIRDRELTEDEMREVMLRARQVRYHENRRRRYWLEPDYRQRQIDRSRAFRARNEAVF